MKVSNILIMFFLGLLMAGIFFPKSSNAAQSNFNNTKEIDADEFIKSAQTKESTVQQEEIFRPRFEYKAQGLKDPFLPLVQDKEAAAVSPTAIRVDVKPLPALTLQGLVWGGNFPQAIINNRLVKIGDIIEGVEVADIGKEGVILFYANKKYKLSSPAVRGSQKKD